ncbi:MAG: hypothetical protein A3G33_10900 [Omnitrophica bacterium RIFCSPLOWO2_12_FULL_44_17]|uniref:Uncharacterized protein n=1 Tax=Candidatus Danuiimicrobium aquiferis TaxID=1801832 RepID=A0A1G1KRF7_9BACT|nr:MAG: hypothetical protein A3B72_03220 [Omnitrophica bacterium RIFCSPHIGHO2_02_FULL_45_28]OGW88650.1 MAG: hypothetical protein A3E74_05945 [Omnitrophica bacterium RIFCSPHIGHO2_12_FULL_44_12]OGW95477.1 MAG: hypothetical protein A3G33_10900 [Omnitrophica bacterium RIFCSPLOWO2_12_FULL_44_17]OGX03356.1 MAG: hypothetical protein A3J12_07540 [Omnitrophica bacterium RIFCSPLOWO2_02_FULL_44_11]
MFKLKKEFSIFISAMLALSLTSCNIDYSNKKEKSDHMVQAAAKMFAEKKLPEAVALLKEAVALNPENGKIDQLLGDVYYSENDFESAQKSYDQAVAKKLDDAELHNSLGVLAMKKGEAQIAIQHFMNATQKDPKLVAPNIHMGDMALAAKQLPVAMGFYKKALAADPQNPQALTRIKQIEHAVENPLPTNDEKVIL